MTVRLVPFCEFVEDRGGLEEWHITSAVRQIGAPAEYVVIADDKQFSATFFAMQRFADEYGIPLYFFNYHTIFVKSIQDAMMFRLGFEQ